MGKPVAASPGATGRMKSRGGFADINDQLNTLRHNFVQADGVMDSWRTPGRDTQDAERVSRCLGDNSPRRSKKSAVLDRKTAKTVVRYQVTVDAGIHPETGKRQQVRRRYATEKQARDALAEVGDTAAKRMFVARSAVTVERVCADYVAGRHKLRATSLSKLAYDLAPLRERHGDLPVQRLSKGSHRRAGNRSRRGRHDGPPKVVSGGRGRPQQSTRSPRRLVRCLLTPSTKDSFRATSPSASTAWHRPTRRSTLTARPRWTYCWRLSQKIGSATHGNWRYPVCGEARLPGCGGRIST